MYEDSDNSFAFWQAWLALAIAIVLFGVLTIFTVIALLVLALIG